MSGPHDTMSHRELVRRLREANAEAMAELEAEEAHQRALIDGIAAVSGRIRESADRMTGGEA